MAFLKKLTLRQWAGVAILASIFIFMIIGMSFVMPFWVVLAMFAGSLILTGIIMFAISLLAP